MAEIILSHLVEAKRNELLLVLFDSKYFATEDNAIIYVKAISDFIESVPELRHRSTRNINMVLGITNTNLTNTQLGSLL